LRRNRSDNEHSPNKKLKWKPNCQKRYRKPGYESEASTWSYEKSATNGCSLPTPIPLSIFQLSLVISDGDATESEENGTIPIYPTPIPSSFWLWFRPRFSVFTSTEDGYDSDCVSNSDVSENQPWVLLVFKWFHGVPALILHVRRVWRTGTLKSSVYCYCLISHCHYHREIQNCFQ